MRYDELPAFLVSAALYREETIENSPVSENPPGYYYLKMPRVVERECPQCGMTKWDIIEGTNIQVGFHALTYQCRNCRDSIFRVWLLWRLLEGVTKVVKAGHYPKLEVTIPKEFENALGEKRSLYLRGMTSRHNGYGIGALTYFRRLIEDTTDGMLGLLEEAMEAAKADHAAIEALRKAKDGRRFEDKVKIAAEVMPAHLKPGGINPFGDLYELLSIGLHDRCDEECCDIVDAMDKSLKFIYTQLKTHAEDTKAYERATKSIQEILARSKRRDST
jgi:hypothetical protein